MYDKYLKELENRKLSLKKEVNKLDDDFNIIFKYEIKNAFGMLEKGFFITTENGNNVYLYTAYNCNQELKIDITEIINILNKYAEKLQPMAKLPLNGYLLDGYINSINFKVNNKWYNFKYSNLFAYGQEEIDNNKNLTYLFDFLDELYDYFETSAKAINDYFVLELDD